MGPKEGESGGGMERLRDWVEGLQAELSRVRDARVSPLTVASVCVCVSPTRHYG